MTDNKEVTARGESAEQPALGCDFMGQDFGATYPDSICIDGYLWDADSGNADRNGEGWIYTCGGEIPCPSCNEKAAAKYADKPLKKIREYVQRMKGKWGTFHAPASLREVNR
jgi:hypothetical protein